MTELIRDTTFGHCLRFISRGKLLPFAEERDPSLWKQFVNEEASGNAAHHGTVDPPEKKTSESESSDDDDEKLRQQMTGTHSIGGVRTRDAYDSQSPDSSEKTRVPDDGTVNIPSGVKVDPEKGRDVWIVDWYGPDDPEVSTCMAPTTAHNVAGTDLFPSEPNELVSI